MKFYIAKSDKSECYGCKSQILEGETFLVEFLSKKTSIGMWRKTLIFHIDCYRRWLDDNVVKQWQKWKDNIGSPSPRLNRPKRGRPIIHIEPTKEVQINRIKTLLNYHVKIGGHETKVKLLQRQLDKVRG